MAPWKNILAAAFAAMSVSLTIAVPGASASSFSTDTSDLWWNEAESGWGMQIIQRADVVFATLYVYDAKGAPTWYAAVLNYAGATGWSGDLMQTSGPWFGTQPFNQTAVGVTKVGTMSFSPQSVANAVLNYSINGVSVSKNVQRMTVRYDDYNGNYVGMLAYTTEGCTNPMDRRGLQNNRIDFSIMQSGSTMTMISQQQGTVAVCTSSGTYSQDGQFGNTSQSVGSCTDGSGSGAVTNYYEMNVSPSGVTMNFTAPSSNAGSKGCTLNGSVIGIRQ